MFHQTARAFLPSRPLIVLMAATVLAACAAQALPAGSAQGLNREDGPIEIGSALVLAVGACIAIGSTLRRMSLVRLAGAVVVTSLLLRELDFQKRFTYRSIESIGFYTRPIASLTEKVVALAILSVLACAVWILARAAWLRLAHAVRQREAWLGSITAAGVLVACSLISEKFLGFTVAEEVLEAGFAGVVVALCWQAGKLAAAEAPAVQRPTAELLAFEGEAIPARTREHADRGHRVA